MQAARLGGGVQGAGEGDGRHLIGRDAASALTGAYLTTPRSLETPQGDTDSHGKRSRAAAAGRVGVGGILIWRGSMGSQEASRPTQSPPLPDPGQTPGFGFLPTASFISVLLSPSSSFYLLSILFYSGCCVVPSQSTILLAARRLGMLRLPTVVAVKIA